MTQKDLDLARKAILKEFNDFLRIEFGVDDLPGAFEVRSMIVGQFSQLREKLPTKKGTK